MVDLAPLKKEKQQALRSQFQEFSKKCEAYERASENVDRAKRKIRSIQAQQGLLAIQISKDELIGKESRTKMARLQELEKELNLAKSKLKKAESANELSDEYYQELAGMYGQLLEETNNPHTWVARSL